MEFTFGIITTGNDEFIRAIIESIESEDIETYEIIVVGLCNIEHKKLTVIPFNENIRPVWITRKKNIIAQNAKYENIVIMHDYIVLEKGWYKGFLQIGNDWDVCMCRIYDKNGRRTIDWMGLPSDPLYGNVMLPYDYYNPHGMYVPGNYFVVKKQLLLENPLDERRGWCEGEDIEWSKRIFGGIDNSEWMRGGLRIPMNIIIPDPPKIVKYKMNIYSSVRFIKDKETYECFYEKYDLHSGDNSRPIGYDKNNYYYLKFRKEKIEVAATQ